jgi:transcriptional regulator with XRE-family HTH domain
MMNFSEALKLLLQSRGESASDVANATGIANSTLSKLMSSEGSVEPNIKTRSKLSNYFNIPLDEFTPEGIASYIDDKNPEKILERLKNFEKSMQDMHEIMRLILKTVKGSNEKIDTFIETVLNIQALEELGKEKK